MQLADFTSKVRSKIIIKFLNKQYIDHKKVLDVGCGNGIISKILENEFELKLTGCDVLNYLARDIKFVMMNDKNKLPFKNKSFDFVMFIDTLHHMEIEQQEQLIKESLRVGRTILIFELLPTFWGKVFDFFINQIHNPKMKIPFSYRSINEWMVLFSKMNAKANYTSISSPNLYPFKHVAYILRVK